MKSKNPHFLLLLLPALLFIGGCMGNTTPQNTDTTLSGTTSMDTTPVTIAQCKTAVDNYLASVKDAKTDTTKIVKSGNTIVVDYIGRLADGEVFDTSIESVAKECGVYNEARNYTDGLEFVAGSGQVVVGFDEGVMNMALNETKTIEMSSEKAYGGVTISYPKTAFPTKPDGTDYVAGESFMTMQGNIEIASISGDEISIKNPSPLAGKDLIFDVTLKAIK